MMWLGESLTAQRTEPRSACPDSDSTPGGEHSVTTPRFARFTASGLALQFGRQKEEPLVGVPLRALNLLLAHPAKDSA